MSSKLQGTSLRINDTQEIVKIKTSVNNTNDEVPTSGAVKDLIDSLIPVTLEVEGDWTNKQVRYRIPDPAGLSFKVTYKNGNTAYVGARLVSPEAWPNTGLQTATFSYTENGITIYGTRSIGIELLPISLTITGDWSNYQYAGLAPDPDGLTFTVTYDDDSTAVVSGLTVTPGTWGNTEGNQTATFSYSQEVSSGTVTKTATKDANVVRKPISLTVTGSLNDNYQFYNNPPDLTGLEFTVGYSNSTTKTILPSDIGFGISPDTWGGMGQQTATFSYTDNGATVTNTQTANVVKKPSSLSIESGSLNDNYQYTNTAPNASTLRFKVYYNDGTSSEEKTVSDGIAVSPETWSSLTGQQPATFSYTENGVTVSVVRNGDVVRMLTGLSIGGGWSKTQYTNTAVDYTGLTFTASYNNNTTATVTPSNYSPFYWGSAAVGTQTCIFYYSENGIKVSASSSVNVVWPYRVGGIIFYINTSSTNTYRFYNAQGQEVSAPSVGTDCTGWAYYKSGTDVDKFYAYYPTRLSSPARSWGSGITAGAYDDSIGSGKTNTQKVLAVTSAPPEGCIWQYIIYMRNNNINGCNDWFVGCPTEYDQLRNSGTTGASWFTDSAGLVWSSRENESNTLNAFFWNKNNSRWTTVAKHSTMALIPIQAF